MPDDKDSTDGPQEEGQNAGQESSLPDFLKNIDESLLDASIGPKPPKPTPEAQGAGPLETLVVGAAEQINPPVDLQKLKVGDRVDAYQIEENPDKESNTTYIGEGASGIIYRARHIKLKRQVALKFLKNTNASPIELEQFETEATSLANLQERNILQVYDFSEWKGNMFIAMELLEGGSAKNRMDKQFGVPTSSGIWRNLTKIVKKEEVPAGEPKIEYICNQADIDYFVNTVIQVAEQLEIAHDKGILHRDIKPGNIMYKDKEKNKDKATLADYGLAMLIKKQESTMTVGTLAYMAPEQVSGTDPVDVRTDVFGIGATLYHMLAGEYVHNFQGQSFAERAATILNGIPTNIRLLNKKVDRNLAAIVHKATAKDPDKRYESANAFYDDLKRWMDGRRIKARPITSFIVPTTRRLRKQGLKWLATAAVSGALVALATSLHKAKEPERIRNVRVENYIAEINSSVSTADAIRAAANKSYETLRQKSLIEMSRNSVDIATLANHQKTISSVFESYNKALKLAEDWKKDDFSQEKKSEEKRRELDVLVKEFETKNDYAAKKASAYEKIVEAMGAYKEKDFAKAEKALALAVERLYEVDTQKEHARVTKEYNMYKEQRTMQGVRDIDARVKAYRRVCRACVLDEIDIFSGSEEDITPETGIEWKKMMTSIEKILETPDDAILRKIPLDEKTYKDLTEYTKANAQDAFDSEQSILKNKDVKREVDKKRNRIAEDKYVAEVTKQYEAGRMDEDEFKLRMRLPPPSQREQFMEQLDKELKKGVSKSLYDKLLTEK